MNALQSYSSDDESGNETPMHKARKSGDPGTNYDDVGMDISEDSEDEPSHHTSQREKGGARPVSSSARPPGISSPTSQGPPTSAAPVTNSVEGQKPHTDSKEGQRPSLQERLMGLASGGGGIQRPSQGEERTGTRDRRDSAPSPSRDREVHSRRKSRSKSPKPKSPKRKSPKRKSPRPRSPTSGNKNNRKTRSRSKSRERDVGRAGHSGRSHSGHSGRGKDSREVRRTRDEDRKRREEERRSRRSRSRSRSRERRRSRSRSRDRRSRSRSRERRRRSRSRERKRPMDIRKEAQQKLAALKAANPDLTAAELLKRSMEAQMVEVQKQTGITLPSYYNPAAMNPMKFAEQERKKKLLWGNKSKAATDGQVPPTVSVSEGGARPAGFGMPTPPGLVRPNLGRGFTGLAANVPIGRGAPPAPTPAPLSPGSAAAAASGQAALWANTRFSNDKDGRMAEKFRRLMGVKTTGPQTENRPTSHSGSLVRTKLQGAMTLKGPETATPGTAVKEPSGGVDSLQRQETMFSSMERQYEMARLATHTHKGFGLGFTSQSFVPK